jgi:hypothetical protein
MNRGVAGRVLMPKTACKKSRVSVPLKSDFGLTCRISDVGYYRRIFSVGDSAPMYGHGLLKQFCYMYTIKFIVFQLTLVFIYICTFRVLYLRYKLVYLAYSHHRYCVIMYMDCICALSMCEYTVYMYIYIYIYIYIVYTDNVSHKSLYIAIINSLYSVLNSMQ